MLTDPEFAINFNPGAGGNWVSHVIWLLQCPHHNERIVDSKNFHDHPQNISTKLLHYSAKPANEITTIELGGFCRFNFFLNYVDKVFGDSLDANDNNMLANLMRSSHGQFRPQPENWDLDYALIFYDPYEFTDDLFRALNEKNIRHRANHELVLNNISKFQRTCSDPRLHFDNMDSIHWLTWCGGILSKGITGRIENIDGSESMQDIRNRILPHHEYLINETSRLTLFTN